MMKKIFAVALALMMALSLTGVSAEEPPVYSRTTMTMNINSQLIQMMNGGGDETLDAVLSMINKIALVAHTGENNAVAFDVNANGSTVMTLKGAMTADGYAIASDLFPSYVLTLGDETMDAILSTEMTGNFDALAGLSEAIEDIVSESSTAPVAGEYTVNGKTYESRFTCTLDSEALMAILTKLVEIAQADMPSIPDPGDADLLVEIVGYIAANGTVAVEMVFSEEAVTAVKMLLEVTPTETGATVIAYAPTNSAYDNWEAAIAALNAGEDEGFTIIISVDEPTDDMDAIAFDASVYNAGQYMVGIKLNATQMSIDFVLSMMSPDMPLFGLNIMEEEVDAPADAAIDTANLTAVDLMTLVESIQNGSELGQAVMNDLTYGMNIVLVNLIQAFPDEMTVLMAPMMNVETVPAA